VRNNPTTLTDPSGLDPVPEVPGACTIPQQCKSATSDGQGKGQVPAQNKKPDPKPKPRPLVKGEAGRTIPAPKPGQHPLVYQRDVYYYTVTPDGTANHEKHQLSWSETFVGTPNGANICASSCVEKDPGYISNGETVDRQEVDANQPYSVERRWSVDGQAAGVLNEQNKPFDFEILKLSTETNPPFQTEYGNDPSH
jgi:hypothetical protein